MKRAWQISGGIAVGFWFLAALMDTLALALVPGLILIGWGLAMATNWRGVADAMPTTSSIGPFSQNDGPDASPPIIRRTLRVSRADFRGLEGSTWPAAEAAVRSHGRSLDAYAEVRTVTPSSVAPVNRALATVHACHA